MGNGYPALGGKMPEVVLVRDDAGDSATGEKYESPPRGPGEPAVPDICVWTLRGAGGAGSGNLGGGCRTMLAKDCVLSPVADLARRLLLEEFLGIVPDSCGLPYWEPVGVEP